MVKTMQLTPEQMEGIFKGAELSGTLAGEPPYKQQEIELFDEKRSNLRADTVVELIKATRPDKDE